MMGGNQLVFNCTALVGTNKVGLLPVDSNGYREVVLGALDFNNSIGQQYNSQAAEKLLAENSAFMRRVQAGYLKGEYGHPKKQPGMSMRDYLIRIMTIEETLVSHHIKSVWIDRSRVRNGGQNVVAIMGMVKPAGPYGPALEKSFSNPDENVAFSIRSITDDYLVRGRVSKHLREIAGWDHVVEPGLSVANKYQAPALESLNQDFQIDTNMIRMLVESPNEYNIATESADLLKNLLLNSERAIRAVGRKAPSATW